MKKLPMARAITRKVTTNAQMLVGRMAFTSSINPSIFMLFCRSFVYMTPYNPFCDIII